MTPQLAFDPYIVEQASCRASLLIARNRFPADDWEDLRQEMVLDCLERLPWFNSDRGGWQAFVRGVIRHESTTLVWRELRRIHCEPLPEITDSDDFDNAVPPVVAEPCSADPSGQLAVSADVQRVVALLPKHLRILAGELAEMSVPEIAEKRGTSTQWIYEKRKKLRKAFIKAGVTPESMRRRGDMR